MTIQHLSILFTRDLNRLKSEINAYENEQNLWIVVDGITNSAGNLCLHLNGNLKAFIGAELGDSGYVRDRPREFNDKNIARSQMVKNIDQTIEVVNQTLAKLNPSELAATYPKEVFGSPMTNEYFLFHLYGHLNYHLGQINYHRRIIEGLNTLS